jgi:chloramphenicol O-acetyltransferase type A
MRIIPLSTWKRREHFKIYRAFSQPHFAMCTNVDVTSLYTFVKERGDSFTVAVTYVLARVANDIPEFRFRIRGEEVVEHEVVHPSTTILAEGDLFSFCTVYYSEDYAGFSASAAERIAYVKKNPTLKDEPGLDNLLFMTSIPWVSFTSFMHPLSSIPPDSVPRFAWGKWFEEGSSLKMPLAVQVHHALMDGFHVGKFYAAVQEYLIRPDRMLGNSRS